MARLWTNGPLASGSISHQLARADRRFLHIYFRSMVANSDLPLLLKAISFDTSGDPKRWKLDNSTSSFFLNFVFKHLNCPRRNGTHVDWNSPNSFSVAAAQSWNALPSSVSKSPSLYVCHRRLKTETFRQSYPTWTSFLCTCCSATVFVKCPSNRIAFVRRLNLHILLVEWFIVNIIGF